MTVYHSDFEVKITDRWIFIWCRNRWYEHTKDQLVVGFMWSLQNNLLLTGKTWWLGLTWHTSPKRSQSEVGFVCWAFAPFFSLPGSRREDELKCVGVGPLHWPQHEKRHCLIDATRNKKTRFAVGRTRRRWLENLCEISFLPLETLCKGHYYSLRRCLSVRHFPSVSGSVISSGSSVFASPLCFSIALFCLVFVTTLLNNSC